MGAKAYPNYEKVTIRGTERLLKALREFAVEQFVFASTMLVHAPGKPGQRLDEDSPLDPKLPYRASKMKTEKLIREQRGKLPVVLVRPAGVYDGGRRRRNPPQPAARQARRRALWQLGSLRPVNRDASDRRRWRCTLPTGRVTPFPGSR